MEEVRHPDVLSERHVTNMIRVSPYGVPPGLGPQDARCLAASHESLRAKFVETEETLERTLFIAEHLWAMVPQSAWHDSGGDDMQDHYEGDYHAEKARDELTAIREKI